MLSNCICWLSISSPFSVTFHLSHSEKQAGNFDNPSSNCKACDWISVITSMSGLLETCQKVCCNAGSVKNCCGFFVFFFLSTFSAAQCRRGKSSFRRRKVFLKDTDFHMCLGTVPWDLNSSRPCILS